MTQDPRVGTVIGGYLIERLLGRGGMGIVYLAHHERLDRKVALKVLAPEWSEDASFQERFVRESRVAASLDHPNVIPVFDADQADGLLFIAMRYVDGRDLKQVITAEGPLDIARTIRLLRQAAGALDAAHERGLIHRDIKPANILVTNAGPTTNSEHVYLTDFGLTKHRGAQSGLTATGAFVGTIDYIAPEQIEGKELDNRSDIYALGCILYECLTGETPFVKDSDVAVMYAHLMDPRPSPRSIRPELPEAADAIVATAMAREPDERYPTGATMVDALEAVLAPEPSRTGSRPAAPPSVITESEPVAPEPGPPEDRSPRRLLGGRNLLLLGVVVVLVAVASFLLSRPDQPTDTATEGGGVADKTRYAYLAIGERGLERIPLEPGAEPEPLRPLLPEAPQNLTETWATISPNGEWLIMDSERLGCEDYVCLVTARNFTDLEVVQVGPEVLHTAGSGYSAITSDGNTVVFPDDRGPHEIDLWATSRARIAWDEPVLLSGDSDARFNDHPMVSPDGTKVLFDCRPEIYDPARGNICEASLDGDGLGVAVGAEDGPGAAADSYVRHGSYAPDGSIVFEAFWNNQRQIWRHEAGSEPELINPTHAEDTSPCVLPDGTVASLYEGKLKFMSPDGLDFEVVDLKLRRNQYVDTQLTCG